MPDFITRFQFFFYPLVVHLSVVYKIPFVIAGLLPLFYIIFARPFQGASGQILIKSMILFVLLVMAVLSWIFLNHSIIYLPPILMMMAILYPFIRSVMPGNTPLITRFYELTEEKKQYSVIKYTRKLTWVWIVFIVLLLINTLYLTFFSSLQTWSLFTNFINYLLLLLLMIVEWSFRGFWFGQWDSPLKFARQLLTVDQKALLGNQNR